MIRNALIAIAILASFSIHAAPLASAKPHTKCWTKELARRDCELTNKPYKAQLSRMKVTWSDGTWTSIADAPLTGENFQWQDVRLEKFASGKKESRWLLQFWIWDDGKGEAKVQSLHWIVMELKDKRLIAHVDQIVRKREVHATQPISYTYDRLLPHSIKKIKGGLQWTVDRNVGTI